MTAILFSTNYSTGPENTPAELEVIDDYTFKFKFARSQSTLYLQDCTRHTPALYARPLHEPIPCRLDERQSSSGCADKRSRLRELGSILRGPQLVVHESRAAKRERPGLPRIRSRKRSLPMERNPYFFGVDADGNQLPYVDNITHRLFDNNEVLQSVDHQRRDRLPGPPCQHRQFHALQGE